MFRRVAALFGATLLAASACSYTSPEIEPALPDEAQTSRIYAGDGSLLAALHAEENRRNLSLKEIPKHVQDAVIAIEDERFWRHNGVDVRAVVRAGLANAAEGEVVQGGSTITQQYVKNALLDTERSVERKVREAALAIQMERSYTKQRILELYLNSIYFGNGAYGVDAAAHEYFGKSGTELTMAEGATIAGLIRAPSRYDPYDDPGAARERRNAVLDNMHRLGWAEPEEVTWLKATPVELAPERPADERYPAGHFVEVVKQFILDDPRFGKTPAERQALLFTGGLRITTTVHPVLQAKAEYAVSANLAEGAGPEGALVAIDPSNGFVRALVGGRDFFGGGGQAKYNLATQGGRQAGSSFKPFVLAAALEEGLDLSRQ
ncbi:MAG: transglycosylase domain-containing protein, partial [Actinomycetota bacterium]